MNVRLIFSFVLIVHTGLLWMPPVSNAQHFVEDNGWYFLNFGTPLLTWEQYRDTFIGTPPTYSYAASAIDAAFYDGVYKNQLSPPGNCYGMSLMAQLIRDKGGHLGFCYPVSQYSGGLTVPGTGPSDSRLTYAINVMHGHQVNLNSLKQYLELLSIGKTRDGNFAFQQAEYYELSDDYTIVSITKSLSPTDGGHTMAVYDTLTVGSEKRIYVYDPNRSWYESTGQSWYRSGSNYISIQSSSGAWSFVMAGSTGTWSGSPSSGGNIVITPISLCGPRDRSPASMGLDALSFLNQFFIYGSGNEITQVTNSQGKRLFKPGTIEIDNDPNTGLLNTVPIYPSDGNPPYDFQSFVMFGNPGGPLQFDVKSAGNGYTLELAGPRSIVRIQAVSKEGYDRFFVENPGMLSPRLKLTNNIAAEKYEVKFTQIVNPGKESRIFHLMDMAIPPKNLIEFAITPDRKGLKVISPNSSLGFGLQIERWELGKEKQIVQMPQLQIAAGQSQLFKPINWQILQIVKPIVDIAPIITQPIFFQ